MNRWTTIAFVAAGLLVMLGSGGYLTARFNSADRTLFLPGATTHGHYQIELACSACHDVGNGLKEQSCIDCHDAELKAANDSHPMSKFTDPRNADRLQLIRADRCVTCHREHQPAITGAMGVTQPADYCVHCHQQTLTDRPSHQQFKFDSCATAGCHNYHDNTALYENFLTKHGNEPDVKSPAVRPTRDLRKQLLAVNPASVKPALAATDAVAPRYVDAGLIKTWHATSHARSGVNCADCHEVPQAGTGLRQWQDRPGVAGCRECHAAETEGFLAGHHGMRLAQELSPMTPALARQPMRADASHAELSCSSCHGAHEFDTRHAAVDACLSCHNDEHSLNYQASAHFRLWQAENSGLAAAGSGVSCATCHLPRESREQGGVTLVSVQHNQNNNLRPNEKMIRSVCLDCHGLGFAIDALADPQLVHDNFNGRPAAHIESIDLALRRQLEKEKPKQKTETDTTP